MCGQVGDNFSGVLCCEHFFVLLDLWNRLQIIVAVSRAPIWLCCKNESCVQGWLVVTFSLGVTYLSKPNYIVHKIDKLMLHYTVYDT